MKYAIIGFNQELVISYSTDIDATDLLLLDYIYNAIASPGMLHIVKNDIAYVWLQHKKILSDLPILCIGEEALKKRIKKLVDLQLIESIIETSGTLGKRAFYGITDKCESLRYSSVKNYTWPDNQVEKITLDKDEPSVKNYTSNIKLFKIDNKLKNKDKDKEEIQTFISLYHEICKTLPKVRNITDKRKKAIQNIIKKYSLEDIKEVFTKSEESGFMHGNNDRGWKADLDFILREDKFVNILEGKYNSKVKSVSSEGHLKLNRRADKQKLREDITGGKAEKF